MSIALKLIISGICLVVPGDQKAPTRMTCPNATLGGVSSSGNAIAPHYPYLIINEDDLADKKQAATASFRMGTGGKQLVWILDSASIRIKETSTPGTKSIALREAIDLARVWPGKGKVRPEYWDVAANPDKVSSRFDIAGAQLSTGRPGPITWEFQPKQTPDAVVQKPSDEIVATLTLPSATIQVRNYGSAAKYESLEIALRPSADRTVDVSVGNAPLNDVLLLPHSTNEHHLVMHDFELFYRLFNQPPSRPPVPTSKSMSGNARGHDTCVPAICTDC
jgi:hypothetical protein